MSTPRYEVWLDVSESGTAVGQPYVIYEQVRRHLNLEAAEADAREHHGLIHDLETGDVFAPQAALHQAA